MIRIYEDTYLHIGLRKQMIEQLREKLTQKNMVNENVLNALQQIPRHCFLDPAFDKIAYEDSAFSIGANQTISMPYTVAYQTTLLNVKPLEKILEIGTGSAYQASVLAQLGAQVFTIERQKELYDLNAKNYPLKSKALAKRIKFFYGDGFAGLPNYAPFNKILITAGAPHVPAQLIEQLVIGGIMVIPLDVNDGLHQVMKRYTKISDTQMQEEVFDNFSFVPMLNGTNKTS